MQTMAVGSLALALTFNGAPIPRPVDVYRLARPVVAPDQAQAPAPARGQCPAGRDTRRRHGLSTRRDPDGRRAGRRRRRRADVESLRGFGRTRRRDRRERGPPWRPAATSEAAPRHACRRPCRGRERLRGRRGSGARGRGRRGAGCVFGYRGSGRGCRGARRGRGDVRRAGALRRGGAAGPVRGIPPLKAPLTGRRNCSVSV